MKALLFVAILLLLGCKGKSQPGEKSIETEKSFSSIATSSSVASSYSASVSFPSLSASAKSVSKESVALARQLNKKGLAKHRAGDWDQAKVLFAKALAANPRHLKARYNLACSYNLSGEPSEALKILKEFKDEKNCDPCLERLVRASNDPDLKNLHLNETFQRIVKLPEPKPLTAKWAQRAAWNTFSGGTKYLLEKKVTVISADSGTGDVSTEILVGRSKLRYYFDQEEELIPQSGGDQVTCDSSCCTWTDTSENPGNSRGDTIVYYGRLCFSTKNSKHYLTKIYLSSGV